jgi:hypothetical protein
MESIINFFNPNSFENQAKRAKRDAKIAKELKEFEKVAKEKEFSAKKHQQNGESENGIQNETTRNNQHHSSQFHSYFPPFARYYLPVHNSINNTTRYTVDCNLALKDVSKHYFSPIFFTNKKNTKNQILPIFDEKISLKYLSEYYYPYINPGQLLSSYYAQCEAYRGWIEVEGIDQHDQHDQNSTQQIPPAPYFLPPSLLTDQFDLLPERSDKNDPFFGQNHLDDKNNNKNRLAIYTQKANADLPHQVGIWEFRETSLALRPFNEAIKAEKQLARSNFKFLSDDVQN